MRSYSPKNYSWIDSILSSRSLLSLYSFSLIAARSLPKDYSTSLMALLLSFAYLSMRSLKIAHFSSTNLLNLASEALRYSTCWLTILRAIS